MSFVLIPTPIIVFQLLALLISTTMEAWIFFRKLHFSRQVCIQYAMTINLVSTTFIWLFGLTLQALLPPTAKLYVMSYVLLGEFYKVEQNWANTIVFLVILSLIFWLVCLVEFKGIDILQLLLDPELNDQQNKIGIWQRIYTVMIDIDSERLATIFIANAFSNSTILLIVLVGLVQRYD
ncbi:MAG: hypothetical protein F6J87_17050 [Spirulina sp. SIO3F2]|nr:hypothetical protein [Spirulina sp. SIO3F2]